MHTRPSQKDLGCMVAPSSSMVLAVPSTEIHEWITDLYISKTLYINETHTHITKTEFVTSFLDLNMSDFDLYILYSLAGIIYSDPMGPSFAVCAHGLKIIWSMLSMRLKN
jgi:hypothetical protein